MTGKTTRSGPESRVQKPIDGESIAHGAEEGTAAVKRRQCTKEPAEAAGSRFSERPGAAGPRSARNGKEEREEVECKRKGCQNRTCAVSGLCLECACKAWWWTHRKQAGADGAREGKRPVARRSATAAKAFLGTVFGNAVGGGRHVVIFALPGASSKGFRDITAAERYATSLADRCDVYVGAGLYHCARRGNVNDVSALLGLWADIDFADPVHEKPNLPRDEGDARRILSRLPYWPSIIVHSGHGLQCWWLFQRPLAIETEADRRVAMALAKAWTDYVRREAWKASGWDVDATGDLARVLRLPGTVNRKRSPAVPVRVLEPEGLDGNLVRYKLEDLRQFARAVVREPTKKAGVGALVLSPNAKLPAEKFAALLANDKKFRHTWERTRPDLQDQSPSGFDMSLAAMAAGDGWEDQEIANLLIAARRVHGEDLKLREDYYQRTIARARAGLGGTRMGKRGRSGSLAAARR